MMKCFLCILIVLSCISVGVLSILQKPLDDKEEFGLFFLKHFPNARVQRLFDLPLTDLVARDNEWKDALAHNAINDTVIIGHHGLAQKYIFILEGGYVAMAKPVERNLMIYSHDAFKTVQWDKENPHAALRMDRDYQGWGELGGVALDRVLGWYRKQTVVGRYLDSKLLYYHDYSIWGRILYFLPSHKVPVAMHAWVTDLYTKSPSLDVGKYLTIEKEEKPSWTLEKILSYADVVIFDFLLDDHDRLGNHNWKVSADGKIFAWDSGLAWNFGPKNADTEILCGTHVWNGDDAVNTPYNIKRPDCTRICRFRKKSILLLRSIGPDAVPEGKAGYLMKKELEKDTLSYLFEYGVYKVSPSGLFSWFYEAARFSNQDFYEGIDEKIDILLDHVDHCIAKYGEDKVLLSAEGEEDVDQGVTNNM